MRGLDGGSVPCLSTAIRQQVAVLQPFLQLFIPPPCTLYIWVRVMYRMKSVLRIRIRDPVLSFVTPGSGMGKKSRSRYEKLEKVLVINNQILLCGCGPGIFFTLDLGPGMEKFGSRINIPDSQHWNIFFVQITFKNDFPNISMDTFPF